ncbi:hypothetical protein TruAng_001766 [Truncatella angustata]|nr:hypothetical protein TruAng_001766 [Truncatella angustata]
MSFASSPILALSPSMGHQDSGTPPPGVESSASITQPHTSHARRRRDKPQLSSRCDRKHPCANCFTRGQMCVYPENHTVASAPSIPQPSLAATPNLQDRLDHLERLVLSLKNETSDVKNTISGPSIEPSGSVQDSVRDGSSEGGSMHFSAAEHRYISGDHWAAILNSIADLRDHFDRQEHLGLVSASDGVSTRSNGGQSAGVNKGQRALLLYGCRPATSRADILAALPPREAYENFWQDPSQVPIIWLGLLFGMIALAVLSSEMHEVGNGNSTEQLLLQVQLYREKITQCLIMSEYTKCGPYVLETIIHYVYVEYLLKPDADQDLWFLLALEVNTAKRMGYHRDPRHFSDISILEGEMRRRLWATVLQSDILISSQMGMPRMTSDCQSDTAEPRNLNDTDLDQDTTELPPSRPETEHTTTIGVIARRRLLVVLGTISDLTAKVKPVSYSEFLKVDNSLHEAADSIPQPLKMKPITSSMTDSQQLIMARLFLNHMFYKGQLLLHQRFLYMPSTSSDKDTFEYSRKACIDASLGTLQIQQTLDEETCPGGQLDTLRWRVTSIMNHQFLTATMILCSLLYRGRTIQRIDEITAALLASRAIWMRRSVKSREAQKAAETVSMVLARAGASDRFVPEDPSPPTSTTTTLMRDIEISLGLDQIGTLTNVDHMLFPQVPGPTNLPFAVTFTESDLQQPMEYSMNMDMMDRAGWALPQWLATSQPSEPEAL